MEQVLGITVGLADSIMVSSAGEAAVSGVSLVDSINILLVNLFCSLSTGGAVAAAHHLGRTSVKGGQDSRPAASVRDGDITGCCTDIYSRKPRDPEGCVRKCGAGRDA